MYELQSLVEGLTRTAGGDRMRIADLVDVEPSQVCSVITAALWESDGAVSNEICAVQHCFTIKPYCGAPGMSTGGLFGQP